MIHNFRKSLLYERSQAPLADRFYREKCLAVDICRFNNDTASDMEMQYLDIDLQLKIKERTYLISEKFRDKDYGDMYLELYSKYPLVKGWMHTGRPDAIVYFTPANVYWINHNSLKRFFTEQLFPKIDEKLYSSLVDSEKNIVSYRITLNGEKEKINLIKADNKDGNEWTTLGISVSFDALNRHGVRFLKFGV